MAGPSISVLSTVYIQIPVRALVNGVAYNPTADTVQMAFVTTISPGTSDWKAASWASTSAVNGVYLAQCLVGPGSGGLPLAIDSYNVWIKITDNPEVPVIFTGTLTITP